jgi:hypothetical protein
MKGSLDLTGFPLDLNPVTIYQELSPGSCRATITVPGSPQRLFFRVER